jgi:hypothetical protein
MIREAIARLRSKIRPVKEATASIPGAEEFRRGGLISPWLLGPYGTGEAAMQVTALSACVRLIEGNVAKLPCHLFRLVGEDRKRDRKHPIDLLLNQRPNSWQTAFEFRRMLTAHVALFGNAYAVKVMSGARVDELIPLQPSKVKVIKDDPFDPPSRDQIRTGKTKHSTMGVRTFRDHDLDRCRRYRGSIKRGKRMALHQAAGPYATSQFWNSGRAASRPTDKNLTEDQLQCGTHWKAISGASGTRITTILRRRHEDRAA